MENEWYEYFNDILTKVRQLDKKQYEQLEDFLSDMEQDIQVTDKTIKDYEKYIKRFKSKNRILFIAFKTRNKNTLAHICRYIIDLEWHNEWAIAVAGQSTPTIFGWFNV